MRQLHRAGEKTFIDFSGKRPARVDRHTGELRRVELFVAVLGSIGFTYAEATATQQLPDWVDAHVRNSSPASSRAAPTPSRYTGPCWASRQRRKASHVRHYRTPPPRVNPT